MTQEAFAKKTRFIAGLLPVVLAAWLFTEAVTKAPNLHILPLQFNPYALLSGAALLVNVGLMVYFYTKPARTEERIWLFVYMLGAALFTAAQMMQHLSASPYGAGFWSNFITVASILPVATFMFALSYTNPSERRFPWLTALLLIFPLVYVFFVNNTDLVYINTNSVHFAVMKPWGWDFNDNDLGPAVGMVTVWYVLLNGLALFQLINFRRHATNPILRRQSLLFIWAVVLPLVVSALTEVVLPLVNITVPPIAPVIGDMALILLVYGVVRYQLLTISPTLFSNTILSIIQESVVVTDDHFNIVYLNPKAETMLGLHASNARMSLLKVMQRSAGEKFESAFTPTMAMSSATVDIDQINLQPIHAGPVPVRVTGSRLRLPDMPLWVMALSDITKELQTRSVIEHEVQVRTKELQEARAYLLSSINSLQQGFVLLNAQLKVEVMNRAAKAIFKVNADSSLPLVLGDFAGNATWDADLAHAVERVIMTKHFRRLDVSAADGSFLQVFISPVLLEAHVLGVAVIIQDVTEQRILDRSKDEFFSIASHELRTPLTAIRGNMSLIREYFPEALKDDGLAAMVTDTHDASVRLIAIVNDFLDSSKLEQGKMEFNLRPVAVAPIVSAAAKDLQAVTEKQKNQIKLQALAKLPKVVADEARLRQIIYNMLSNATKYTESGVITVSGEVKNGNACLRFTDTGKGISPENQKLLFHKFQQAGDPLTRDDTKGTGLGLYIARLLATNMHGNVELEASVAGQGSTFVLTLPLAR